MKYLSVLGVTGSIGTQTVNVVLQHPDEFCIVAMSAGKNIGKLKEILKDIQPEMVCVSSQTDMVELREAYPKIRWTYGEEGLLQIAGHKKATTVVNSLVGFAGLKPTLEAISKKKEIALANKETLVVAGALVNKACKENGVTLLPIDSEHSAILQCLRGNDKKQLKRLLVTASGGSFRNKTREELKDVTKAQALAHPNWAMGAKITIDSATMMNKGFEVIEAHWLFDVDFDHIDVVMHRESVIHSMVEYTDGAVIAQLGSPDMRLPIQYALSYPDRWPLEEKPFDITDYSELHFAKPDFERYPLLKLAYEVGRKQGNLPAIMNAANEEAVYLFLDEKISFLQIEEMVFAACRELPFKEEVNLEDLVESDRLAREFVRKRAKA